MEVRCSVSGWRTEEAALLRFGALWECVCRPWSPCAAAKDEEEAEEEEDAEKEEDEEEEEKKDDAASLLCVRWRRFRVCEAASPISLFFFASASFSCRCFCAASRFA